MFYSRKSKESNGPKLSNRFFFLEKKNMMKFRHNFLKLHHFLVLEDEEKNRSLEKRKKKCCFSL